VLARADDPALTVRAAGTEKVGEVEALVLEVNAESASTRWLVDPQNGRVLRAVSRITGPAGPAEQVVEFSDFRAVDGLTVAFKRTLTRAGQDAGAVELRELVINPAVDAKDFERPAKPAN
jgi:hypothetical protein